MRILVQKFGGTSVKSGEARAAAIEKVIAARKSGYSPVVVVSAIGRAGDPYATDTLLNFAREAAGSELNPRENDLLMSCGEIISAVVLAGAFERRGYAARAVTGWQAGIYTNDRFGNASYFQVDAEKLFGLLNAGIIPVVTGFQGITREGDVTTLGRGGSDTTAAILGSALRAEAIEIYTDVDGIMTADPRLLPEARVLPDVSYNEVFQMADHGAKVIHAKAVEIAMRGNVPLIVRNTMSDAAGTRISVRCARSGGKRAGCAFEHRVHRRQGAGEGNGHVRFAGKGPAARARGRGHQHRPHQRFPGKRCGDDRRRQGGEGEGRAGKAAIGLRDHRRPGQGLGDRLAHARRAGRDGAHYSGAVRRGRGRAANGGLAYDDIVPDKGRGCAEGGQGAA